MGEAWGLPWGVWGPRFALFWGPLWGGGVGISNGGWGSSSSTPPPLLPYGTITEGDLWGGPRCALWGLPLIPMGWGGGGVGVPYWGGLGSPTVHYGGCGSPFSNGRGLGVPGCALGGGGGFGVPHIAVLHRGELGFLRDIWGPPMGVLGSPYGSIWTPSPRGVIWGPPPGINLGPCLGAQGLYGVFWDPHLTRSFWGPFGGTAVPPIGYYPPPPIQSLWGYRCPHGVLGCPIGISGTPYRVFGPPLGSLQGLRVPMGFGPLPWGPFGLQGPDGALGSHYVGSLRGY